MEKTHCALHVLVTGREEECWLNYRPGVDLFVVPDVLIGAWPDVSLGPFAVVCDTGGRVRLECVMGVKDVALDDLVGWAGPDWQRLPDEPPDRPVLAGENGQAPF